MIQALRYEPRGQRQRFEPHEQQRGEHEEQNRHIHMHFHLNLTFRASQERSTPPNAIRVTRIFAALVGATVMPLWLFGLLAQDSTPTTLSNLALISLLAGIALAWCAVGALFLGVWRSTPRGRLVLFLPLVLLLIIPFILLQGPWFGPPLGILFFLLVLLLLFVHPLISVILLTCVSREARALRQTATAHT